ncbi:MAG: hypothetical protein COV67_10315 [Nitrospinae bacterium CG11_big_fil_rev_8_21_14_0_20_56_8]|nr:MAG: hypothetical protein COV67_10315 [Nitrospinae bacterium CG11_big_fil_rev_8_21_14_0_20_56_8]
MTHKIFFKDLDRTIEIPEGMTILVAAEEAGVEIPSSCRKGECGTCKIVKIMGDVKSAEGVAVCPGDEKRGIILSCVSEAKSDLVCESSLQEAEVEARVMRIIPRTADTTSFHLVAPAGEFHDFLPGQFVTVGPVLEGKKAFRCYSISSSCLTKDCLEITVKRQKKGLVSNYFVGQVKTGDSIPIRKPNGNFKLNLEDPDDLVLVGAGSGITPLISMVRSLTDSNSKRKITLLYGCRTESDIIFHGELLDLELKNANFTARIFLSQPGSTWKGPAGRLDESALATVIKSCTRSPSLYTCGPAPVMEMAMAAGQANGIPPHRCHMEAFAPPKSQLPVNFLALEQMRQIDLLTDLDDKVLESIQPHIMIRRFLPGEVIIREGDYGNSAFYIMEGRTAIFTVPLDFTQLGRKPRKKRTVIERLKSLFAKNPRGAEFVDGADVSVSNTSFSAYGLLYDDEGKSLSPSILPQEVLDEEGKPVTRDNIVFLPQGEMFGELAALFRFNRTATVAADLQSGTCKTVEINVQAMRILARKNKNFKAFIEERYRTRSLAQFLRHHELFSSLGKDILEEITHSVEFFFYRPQEVILEEGQLNDQLFLILSGFVRLSKKFEAKDFNFHTLKKGDFFGELSLMSQGSASCSVTAVNNVQAIALPKHLVEKIMREELTRNFILTTSENRKNTWRELESRVASLSLLSFGIDHQLINGQSIMVINLDLCTRCDDCVRACADAHEGYPRFAREGKKFGNTLFPHACMHCIDPLCMDGCPSGALHRAEERGEVLINIDTCVGCTMCVTKCIYDNIIALPVAETVHPDGQVEFRRNASNGKPVLKSMKCDLCVETGDPACVRSCPQGAMKRLSFEEIFQPRIPNPPQ